MHKVLMFSRGDQDNEDKQGWVFLCIGFWPVINRTYLGQTGRKKNAQFSPSW